MPNMDDFYAFKSTSDGDGGSAGCSSGILIWLIVIYIVISIIAEG